MDGSKSIRTAVIVSLLLAAPVLAGCIGSASAATAKGELSTAEQEAQGWASDAELASIVGVEGPFVGDWDGPYDDWAAPSGEHRGAAYWSATESDDQVGDGRCAVWLYVFIADSKPGEQFGVAVDEDGEVLATETDEREEDLVPVGEWRIDSDEAMERAMDRSDRLQEARESDDHSLVMALGREDPEENAAWVIVAFGHNEEGGAFAFAIVDAVTGQAFAFDDSWGFDGDWDGDWGGGW